MPPSTHAARFVDRFKAGWQAETDAAFFAVWEEVLHPDVRLVEPLLPPTRGFQAFREKFGQLRALIPDLRAEVHRWAASGSTVFIEFTLSGSVAGEAVSWGAVDRVLLDEQGLCIERIAYFDPTPLLPILLRHPTVWPQALRGLKR